MLASKNPLVQGLSRAKLTPAFKGTRGRDGRERVEEVSKRNGQSSEQRQVCPIQPGRHSKGEAKKL